jgi:hypothetical protein
LLGIASILQQRPSSASFRGLKGKGLGVCIVLEYQLPPFALLLAGDLDLVEEVVLVM